MRRIFRWKNFRKKKFTKADRFEENRLNKIVEKILRAYLCKIKSEGLKNKISGAISDKNVDYFILNRIKRHLSPKRSITLGKGLGIVDVQYKRGGIQFDFCGLARFLVKKITITDNQILYIADNIISQAEEKYVGNPDYIIGKITNVLNKLSSTEIYKPETTEEKTIYDLTLLIVANYYKNEDECPDWVRDAIENLKKGDFIEDWIETILEHIYNTVSGMSENLYIDFKITFDSLILRSAFKKKTNNGQISKLLVLMGIDIKNLIYGIAYDYLSPSFIEGAGELLKDIAQTFLFDFWKNGIGGIQENKFEEKVSEIYCLTMTFGKNASNQRAFRWFTDKKLRLFLEFCKNQNFCESTSVKADCRCIPFSFPVINLGVITSYKIKKRFEYSTELSELQSNITYYYRIIDDTGKVLSPIYKFDLKDMSEDLEILVLADSQGMVKKDYDIFLKVLDEGVKCLSKGGFIVHMGDFVDDGNNEIYWDWILSSNLWAQNVLMPVSGNHEAKLSPTAVKAGVENSILRHFNLKGLPEQSISTGAYYSYTIGCALFIVLNTNNMDGYLKIDQQQYSWALRTAKDSNAKWKILFTHKSPYSNGPHHHEKDSQEIGKQIIRLVYEAKIDIAIGGHDHVYTRTPAMSWGKCTGYACSKVKENGIIYDLFSNPLGTIFIVPGTSGVKNYKSDLNTAFPADKIINNLNCPIYSKIKITTDRIYFTSYKYSTLTEKSECIDGIIIEKAIKKSKYVSSSEVINSINCISEVPWAPSDEKIQNSFNLFKNLDYEQRLSVYNYKKLNFINKLTENYEEITGGDLEVVKNKQEFLNALNNPNIKTIITDCNEIKMENSFGICRKIIIDRNLCIRGNGRLLFVNFIVKNGATLVLGDSVCIDNSRKIFSCYLALNAVEIKDNSSFIMLDFASVRCSGGIGFKPHGVYLSGRDSSAFLNSKSESFSSGEFLFSSHNSSHVFIESGSYFSLGNAYAVCASGHVEIMGGKIKGIKLMSEAKVRMHDGVITGANKKNSFVPVCCRGEFRIYGGMIQSESKTAVQVTSQYGRMYIFPDHKGSVKINGKDIFIGEIKNLNDGRIKIKLPKKNTNEGYQSIGLYCLYKYSLYENVEKLKLEKSYIKNEDVFKVQEKYRNLVIMGKAYSDIMKSSIKIRDGASFCLLSKPCFVNKIKGNKDKSAVQGRKKNKYKT